MRVGVQSGGFKLTRLRSVLVMLRGKWCHIRIRIGVARVRCLDGSGTATNREGIDHDVGHSNQLQKMSTQIETTVGGRRRKDHDTVQHIRDRLFKTF